MTTKDRLLALEQRCLRIEKKLRSALVRLEGWDEEKMHLYLSPEDKVRLLNLDVWVARYGVSMDYILKVLLHQHFAQHRRKNRYLGIRVNALMSKPSEEYLEQAIQQDFPNMEMKRELQERERRRISRILKEQTKLEMTSVNVDKYETQWARRNRAVQRLGRKFNRPWRGNPWR